MELTQLLGDLPATLIPVVLVLYFWNQSNLRWMAERDATIKAISEERKQWLAWQEATILREFSLQERFATAVEGFRAELHAARSKIQELMARYEIAMMPKNEPRKPRGAQGLADDDH